MKKNILRLFVLIQVSDFLITASIFHLYGNFELNPVIAFLMAKLSFYGGLILAKFVAIMIGSYLYHTGWVKSLTLLTIYYLCMISLTFIL